MWREGLFEAALGEASWDGRMEGAEEEEEDEHGCEGENNECDANAEVQMLRKRFGGRGLGGPFCYSLGHTQTHTHRTSAWLSLVLLCLSRVAGAKCFVSDFQPLWTIYRLGGRVSVGLCVCCVSRVSLFSSSSLPTFHTLIMLTRTHNAPLVCLFACVSPVTL